MSSAYTRTHTELMMVNALPNPSVQHQSVQQSSADTAMGAGIKAGEKGPLGRGEFGKENKGAITDTLTRHTHVRAHLYIHTGSPKKSTESKKCKRECGKQKVAQ